MPLPKSIRRENKITPPPPRSSHVHAFITFLSALVGWAASPSPEPNWSVFSWDNYVTCYVPELTRIETWNISDSLSAEALLLTKLALKFEWFNEEKSVVIKHLMLSFLFNLTVNGNGPKPHPAPWWNNATLSAPPFRNGALQYWVVARKVLTPQAALEMQK